MVKVIVVEFLTICLAHAPALLLRRIGRTTLKAIPQVMSSTPPPARMVDQDGQQVVQDRPLLRRVQRTRHPIIATSAHVDSSKLAFGSSRPSKRRLAGLRLTTRRTR